MVTIIWCQKCGAESEFECLCPSEDLVRPDPTHITACPKCGSMTYFVHEWYVWDGEIYDGALHAHRPSSDIETVACTNCGTEYEPSQFEQIHFG